ncbi:MAG: ABC transporter permease [Clostridium sp.]|uniref:ABC transporter permease n=1 Tax=Clostridium sp. TaxID=1506 RepID=UPI002913FC3F|nr:ABC transporter permease [Clostridium sp.]MDU4937772.1 ABC transporter permease [Clostridium sp.]
MIKYIRIELGKIEKKKYTYVMLAIALVITILGIYFYHSINKSNNALGISVNPFSYDGVPGIIDVLYRGVMIIIGGQLLNKTIIDEYENGTINIPFTCGVNKIKLLVSKIILAWFSILMATILGQVISTIISSFIAITFNFASASLMFSELKECIVMTIYNDLCFSLITFIPLYVGMVKKSSKALTGFSILIFLVTTTGYEQDYLKMFSIGIPAIPLIIGIIGIVSIILSVRRGIKI